MTEPLRPKTIHSAVRVIYRIRASSFLMGFAIVGAHIVGQDYGPLTWALLALQFFAYPHLLYWHAVRARDPLRTELGHLLLDPFLFGIWCALLGMPLWITFALLNCTLINIAYFRDTRGAMEALAAFGAGVLLWAAFTGGIRLDLATGWPTTTLCVVGLTIYLMMTAHAAYARNLKLRETRERLLRSEQALNAANDALQQQIGEVHALQTQLRELANRDPLTGLYNRRYLDATLERELARCRREGQALSLMLIDIDHFKRINDSYGHPAGDEVLKHLADMLGGQARSADVACRYGGEEFLLLLPGMPPDAALERAEHWRQVFAAVATPFGEFRIQATLSIGIAVYPGHGKTPEALIRCADHALYQAKSQGRNRVAIYAAPTTIP